jgi:hypothetical protein
VAGYGISAAVEKGRPHSAGDGMLRLLLLRRKTAMGKYIATNAENAPDRGIVFVALAEPACE